MLSNESLKKAPAADYFFSEDFRAKIKTERTGDGFYKSLSPLVCIGEVRKSGAPVYFCPANNDFCTIQDGVVSHFQSANEAYKSQDW